MQGDEETAKNIFAEAAANSGHALLEEAEAPSWVYGAYYATQAVTAAAATAALTGGIAEMAGIMETTPQANNIVRIISKAGKWGWRLDKAEPGKWIHTHFWRW